MICHDCPTTEIHPHLQPSGTYVCEGCNSRFGKNVEFAAHLAGSKRCAKRHG